ncbi:MAG: hypothetical protein ABL888_23290 [Pirellulaceae bacterium]
MSSLLDDLAMTGMSLGQLASEANKAARAMSCDEDCFVLLGDPDDSVDIFRAAAIAPRPVRDTLTTEVPRRPKAVAYNESINLESIRCVATTGDPMTYPSVLRKIPSELLDTFKTKSRIGSTTFLRSIAAVDSRQGLWLSLVYGGVEHRVTGLSVPCMWCKAECVLYQRRDQQLRWDRTVVNCPACGIVADVPEQNYGSVFLHTPNQVRHKEEFEIMSTCPVPDPMIGFSCVFSLIHCIDFGWSSFIDTQLELTGSRTNAQASMRIAVPRTAYPFVYWIRSTWLTSDGISWVSRPLTVTS